MPEPEKNPNEITWGLNERGDLLIDGTVVEKNTNFHFPGDATSEVPEEEDAPIPDRKNAAVEGEAAVPEKAPEPEPVKAEEPPAPEPPKISEKHKYKLMVRGEWQEKEYSPDEIVARLQMAESYDLRNDELRKKHQKIEPFMHVFERPDFKEWLDSKVAVGDIPAPATPDPPANKDVIEYRLRTLEPDYKEIHQQVIALAATLPDNEADILNRDHASYVRVYDQLKSTRKAATPPPPIPKKEVEERIAAKEVVKQQARVEPPGDAPQEVNPMKGWANTYRQLQRAASNREKFVMYNGKRVETDFAVTKHWFSKPKP